MLSIAIDLCKGIIENLRKENELRLDERIRISGILDEIGSILIDTSEKLKKDEYPSFNCMMLEKLANQLHFQLIDLVNVNDLDNLHKVLVESSNVEKSFAQRKDPQTILIIENAAAEFKTLSLMLKI